nr:pentatricopeptide repeat-containing protein At1g09820-like [Nicotiana tomentosiformis]
MEQGSIKPDTRIYNVVIDALCKDRMMDAAISLFEEMKQKGIPPDVITYNSLIDGLCKFGQLEKVRTLFLEMVNLNIYPDVQTLTIVTDGLCKDEKLLSVLSEKPMTASWYSLAQTSHTSKLTGVLLLFGFETCYQIALAIKDEVEDLEKAGINVIQVDGAALREALPLRKPKEAFYLNWPVDSFRITNFSVQDTTQVDIQSCPHSASQMIIIISVKVCCA